MRTARLDRIGSNTKKQRQRETDNCSEGYAGISSSAFQKPYATVCNFEETDINVGGKINARRETHIAEDDVDKSRDGENVLRE